jgi:TonB family protein
MKRNRLIFIVLSIISIAVVGCAHSDKKLAKERTINEQFIMEVGNKVYSNWVYKDYANFDRSKKFLVTFIVLPNGEITGIKVKQSSGIAEFDESALNAIRKTNYEKPFPEEIKSPFIEMGLSFTLTGAK